MSIKLWSEWLCIYSMHQKWPDRHQPTTSNSNTALNLFERGGLSIFQDTVSWSIATLRDSCWTLEFNVYSARADQQDIVFAPCRVVWTGLKVTIHYALRAGATCLEQPLLGWKSACTNTLLNWLPPTHPGRPDISSKMVTDVEGYACAAYPGTRSTKKIRQKNYKIFVKFRFFVIFTILR